MSSRTPGVWNAESSVSKTGKFFPKLGKPRRLTCTNQKKNLIPKKFIVSVQHQTYLASLVA